MIEPDLFGGIAPWLMRFSFILKVILVADAAFLGIVFLQSSLDKLINFSSNRAYFSETFAKTFLKSAPGLLLIGMTCIELSAGITLNVSIINVLITGEVQLFFYAFVLAALAFLMLIFGLRISKQYAAAASLTGYFLLVLFGMMALALLR